MEQAILDALGGEEWLKLVLGLEGVEGGEYSYLSLYFEDGRVCCIFYTKGVKKVIRIDSIHVCGKCEVVDVRLTSTEGDILGGGRFLLIQSLESLLSKSLLSHMFLP